MQILGVRGLDARRVPIMRSYAFARAAMRCIVLVVVNVCTSRAAIARIVALRRGPGACVVSRGAFIKNI